MENPEAKPAATGDGSSEGAAGDDYACFSVDDYRPPKEEPEWELGCGDGEADDDCGPPDVKDYRDYGEEDPESKVIDVYHHFLKEEPEAELGGGDGDAIDVNSYCDYDPPKREPEPVLPAGTGADSGRDVGYDCSHCGISLCTREFRVEHELRCKVLIKQKKLESQVTKLYHCCYCRCPFLNKEFKEQHQQKLCRKRPIAKRRTFKGTYFECTKCEYVTKRKDSLARHLITHNKNNAEWFTCTQCSYKTVHKQCMTRHTKIHSDAFTCCCSICGKSFRDKQALDDHLVRHHSDESDEVYKLITSKIYTCNICDRFKTTAKTAFKEHLTMTHLKGVGCQKYECPRCPYSTFSKGRLSAHSKRHAGQKDYQCAVCKKQYTRKSRLDSHVLSYHSSNADLVKTITSKIHQCQLCSFQTIIKSKLKSHVQSTHI